MNFQDLNDYVELCSLVGNILDAPGKGGNISVKSGNSLIIKSSGQDMKKKDHLVTYEDVSIRVSDFNGALYRKPSMEYKFHEFIKSKYVVHYHPAYLLPYLCSNVEIVSPYDNIRIPYATPGDDLYEAIKEKVLSSFNVDSGIIFLSNHGVILFSDDLEEIKEMYAYIKNDFFFETESYTPDDVVDHDSLELWLFRNTIENIANKNGLVLNSIPKDEVLKLLNDDNEKYRMKGPK